MVGGERQPAGVKAVKALMETASTICTAQSWIKSVDLITHTSFSSHLYREFASYGSELPISPQVARI